MKRFKEIYKFRRKIMISNIAFAVMAVIIVGIISYVQYSKHITDVIMSSEQKIFNQTNERLNEYLYNTNRLSKTFFLNDESNSFIEGNVDFRDPEVFYSIRTLFSTYLQSEPSIVGLYVMNLENELIAGAGYRNISTDIIDDVKKAAFESVGRGSVFLVPAADNNDVFYAVRMIKSIEDFHDIAVGIVMLDKQILNDMMQNMKITENTVNFIFDENGVLVEGADLPAGIESVTFDGISKTGYISKIIGGKKYFVSCGSLEAANWSLYTLIPADDINSQVNVLLMLLVIMLSLVIVVASVFIYLINYNLTDPLGALIKAFEKVSGGNLKYRAELSGDAELKAVIIRFNEMMDDVENLTRTIYTTQRDLYEAELDKKQSELRMLQSQIKSHFLYNALGSLRGMGRTGNWEQVDMCIDSITDMLRYASRTDEKVRLREEIEYIGSYQSIQNMRYDGKNIIHYELDPDTLDILIAKLMLQPVIENAIEHGYKKGKHLVIKIKSSIDNGVCVLQILDNGKGMSQSVQNELNDRLNKWHSTSYEPHIGHGMGLWNVQKRIKLLFGDEYGITVKSYEDRGTIITIRVPCENGML